MKTSPIALFAYKRPNELNKVINSLKLNSLVSESELYIFVDGPKIGDDILKINEVRKICDEIEGFKKIHRTYHASNQGCANSIINGISSVLEIHESVIIIEDDIITSTNFLEYTNQCLNFYKDNNSIFSISGFSLPFKSPQNYHFDVFYFPRSCSWGWATWANRWFSVDWEVPDFEIFMNDSQAKKNFNNGGSDLVKMLNDYMKGFIDAWDIRFSYSQFRNNGLTVYPIISKVQNIGFGNDDATHTNVFNRYKTIIDSTNNKNIKLPNDVELHPYFVKQFQNKFSLSVRIKSKVKTILGIK